MKWTWMAGVLFAAGALGVGAETVAFWRLDAAADGVDLSNAVGGDYGFQACHGGVWGSPRKPLAAIPAEPHVASGGRENHGSIYLGGGPAFSRTHLRAKGLGTRLELNGRFTVEGWVRRASDPAPGAWWYVAGTRDSSGPAWALSLRNDAGRLRFHLSVQDAHGALAFDHPFERGDVTGDGGWRHVALVYDAARDGVGRWELFLNGVSCGTFANPAKPGEGHGVPDFVLGGCESGDHTFVGEFDLWRVSDSPLPPERFLNRIAVRTLAFWPLDVSDGRVSIANREGNAAYALRVGPDGNVTGDPTQMAPIPPSVLQTNVGCARLGGGIGVHSLFFAPGLGARCDLTNSFTVEGWFRKAGDPVDRPWCVAAARDGEGGWMLSLDSNNGRVQFHLHASSLENGGKFRVESFFGNTDLTNDGEWHHVALAYDPERYGKGAWELYLDGVSQGTVRNPTVPAASHGVADLTLGGRRSFSTSFEGWLACWRVSDGPLSPEQFLCSAAEAPSTAFPHPRDDRRDIARGAVIPDEAYCAQPRLGILRDGSWVCVLTTGIGGENDEGRHVVSTVSSDKGKTWSPLVDIEPSSGPGSSWATCFVTPFDRVYAFYAYGDSRAATVPGQTNRAAAAWCGEYVFRYSDDGGLTWSPERHRLPLRPTAADRAPPPQGGRMTFWGADRPKAVAGRVCFAFTRWPDGAAAASEGWVVASDNLLTEHNAGRLHFRLLPDGNTGLRSANEETVQQEHTLVPLGGTAWLCVFRADRVLLQSRSGDGGQTWSLPERMTYGPGKRPVKSGGMAPGVFQTKNGRYLLVYGNSDGTQRREGTTPVFVSCGRLSNEGAIAWSEPELALYGKNLPDAMDAPDLIEQDGRFWLAETQKSLARIHELDRTLVHRLAAQEKASGVTRTGCVAEYENAANAHQTFAVSPAFGTLDGGGVSVDLWVQIDNVANREILLNTAKNGRGVRVVTTTVGREAALQIELCDGDRTAVWQTDPGAIKNDRLHHVVFLCDTRADVIGVVVDGVFCDGGEKRPVGWGTMPSQMRPVAGADRAVISGSVKRVRLYDRALGTSEAVANFRAEKK